MATEFRTAQLRTPDDGKFQLVGVAAGYNVESAPIPSGRGSTFREVIKPGAFRRALSGEGSDVKCLLNHDVNTVLGRQQNRTLELFDTKLGLGFTCQLNPESQAHRDLYASVQRGDINECSFGFNASPDGEEWKNVTDSRGKSYVRRTLTDVELYDVSVVTHPAYPNSATMVQARSSAAPPRRLRTPAIIEARKRARAESRRRGMCFEDLLQERKFLREGQWLRAKLESTAREIYRDSDIDAANRAKLRKITATIRNQTFLSGAQRLLEDGASAEDIDSDLAELLKPCECGCPECETADCRNCSADEKCAECERIEELEDK